VKKMNQRETERLIKNMSWKEMRRTLLSINNMDLDEYPLTRQDLVKEIRANLSEIKS
jgi:hypothetical protein